MNVYGQYAFILQNIPISSHPLCANLLRLHHVQNSMPPPSFHTDPAYTPKLCELGDEMMRSASMNPHGCPCASLDFQAL